MARQMELASADLVLQIPTTGDELMGTMHAAESRGLPPIGDGLMDFTRHIIAMGPESTVLTLSSGTSDMSVIPGHFQTPDYMLALFKGLGYAADDPAVKWGLEVRLARAEIAQRTGATLIHLFDIQALQTNKAIGSKVLTGQLRSMLGVIADNPQIRAHVAPTQATRAVGLGNMSLIYPNGEPAFAEDYRPVYGSVDVANLSTFSQPEGNIPRLRQKWDDTLGQAASAEGSLRLIERTLQEL